MLSCEFLDAVLVVVAGSELSVVIGVVVVVNIKQNFWPALGEGRAIQSFVLYKLIYLDIPGSFEFFQLYAQVAGSRVRFLFQVHEIHWLYRQEQGDYCQT